MDITAGLSGLIGPILGLITERHNDKRQIDQQGKLNELSKAYNKDMAEFNKEQALDIWEKTNAEAQRKQLEKAGLNVGLMYSQGGGAGATTTASAAAPSQAPAGGGELGMGIDRGIDLMSRQAQIELTKAQTENIKTDTENKAGIERETATAGVNKTNTEIEKIKTETQSEQLKQVLTTYQTEAQAIENNIKSASAEETIKNIEVQNNKLIQETKNLLQQNKINTATANDIIKQARIQTAQMLLQNELLKENVEYTQTQTKETKAKINKIAEEITNMQELREQGKTKLAQELQQILQNKMQTEFNAGDAASWDRAINTANRILGNIIGASK